eukprot:m.389136 g.389136  ORF g.389136 m.389136 type:complete len:852 (-) comp21047_c0_seq2:131-2686(-)
MSHQTYNEIWNEADRQLQDLTLIEQDPQQQPNPTDKKALQEYYSLMYIKYIQIFKNLAEVYDQLVHPQKRRILQTLVDGTMGRVLELKHTLVEIDCNDYHYFDEILSDLQLTPEDIEIRAPRYFRRENLSQLREREKILDAVEAETLDPSAHEAVEELPPLTREDAIRIIQSHERARQGRLRAKFMLDIRAQEVREKRRKQFPRPAMSEQHAASVLQKYIRGYLTRKKVRKQRLDEDTFIGMVMPPPLPAKHDPVVKMAATIEKRHATQDQYETQYVTDLIHIKKKVEQVEGPDMQENMADEIREWFVACRDQTGTFPAFPDAEAGGSRAIFDPPPAPPPDEDGDDGGGADDKKKAKGSGKKKGKGSGKKGKKGKGKKGKGDDDESEAPTGPPPSVYAPLISKSCADYRAAWKYNATDRANVPQKHDRDIVKTNKRKEVEDALRLQVDELMREELKNLKAAVEGGKEKKGKAKKGKGKKGGKKGKGKGKKGKAKKDPTADRTPESIFEELAREGIAKHVPERGMASLVGQYSHVATAHARHHDRNPDHAAPEPSMADVRRVVTLYGTLPLGSQVVHETQPAHVKSVLLVGPKGSGKKSLVTALAHDVGANLFDLSPSNTAGKYTAKKGLDGVDGMLHKVFKVAKLFQPSIVYIGDAATVHVKKKAKEDPFDSTRMKKELPKIVKKELNPGDRVLIVGCDDNPADSDMKALTGVYQKILLVPRPDYGTRIMLWTTVLQQHGASISPALDLSSLAKISDGYTAGDIVACVRKVLKPRRIEALAQKPLLAVEFVPALAELLPVFDVDYAALRDWMTKTPLGKKQEKLKDGGADDDDGGGKKKGKKKSGKKKKKK